MWRCRPFHQGLSKSRGWSNNKLSVHLSQCRLRHGDYYRPPTKLREGNVFSSVCLSRRGVPCDHYPLKHWTSLYRTPLSPALPLPPDMEPHWKLLHTSDIWWPLMVTCSNLYTSGTPTSADIWWLLSTYGQCKPVVRILLHPAETLNNADKCDAIKSFWLDFITVVYEKCILKCLE